MNNRLSTNGAHVLDLIGTCFADYSVATWHKGCVGFVHHTHLAVILWVSAFSHLIRLFLNRWELLACSLWASFYLHDWIFYLRVLVVILSCSILLNRSFVGRFLIDRLDYLILELQGIVIVSVLEKVHDKFIVHLWEAFVFEKVAHISVIQAHL